jgi:DNA-binding response OmpR family regulator
MLLSKKVLVIDNDIQTSGSIKTCFQEDGWSVDCANDGYQGISMFNKGGYCLVILDLVLSGVNGYTVCKHIRKKSDIPIIILTANTKEQDKLNSFYIGVDDYITKPFSLKELIARAYSITRRFYSHENYKDAVSFDKARFVVDKDRCKVFINGRSVELTSTEYKLINVLTSKPQHVFSRNDLMFYVLNCMYCKDSRIIDAHIKNIRKKLDEDPNTPRYIMTIKGFGYKFGVEKDETITA